MNSNSAYHPYLILNDWFMNPKFFTLIVLMWLPLIPIFAFQHSTSESQKHRRHPRKTKIQPIRPEKLKPESIAAPKKNNMPTGNKAESYKKQESTYDTYQVDVTQSRVRFYWTDDKKNKLKSFERLKQQIEKEHRTLIFATNAGIYSDENVPIGLHMEDGKTLTNLNLNDGFGNFYLKPNGIFYLNQRKNGAGIVRSERFDSLAHSMSYATQSGPMLLENGEILSIFGKKSPNRNIRSGVGIIDSNQIVFVISREPVTFYEFAAFFKETFHCKTALYLDGTISKMYLPPLKRYDLDGNFGAMIAITIQKNTP